MKYLMADGTVLSNVHTKDRCAGWHCVVHKPSNHHMALWPHRWDNIFKSMWRECPHQLTHPDPDDLAFLRHQHGDDGAASQSLHPCDGCCQPPAEQHAGAGQPAVESE